MRVQRARPQNRLQSGAARPRFLSRDNQITALKNVGFRRRGSCEACIYAVVRDSYLHTERAAGRAEQLIGNAERERAWLEINLLATNSAHGEWLSQPRHPAACQRERARESCVISGPVIMQATDVIIAGYVALSIISPGYVHAQTRHIVLTLCCRWMRKMRVHRCRRRVRAFANELLFSPRARYNQLLCII